jgi:manganese transport protein
MTPQATAVVGDGAASSTAAVADPESETAALQGGWRQDGGCDSLEYLHSSVKVSGEDSRWYMKLASFAGVGFMVSVGYMDPGNWSTNLAGGASSGYTLLSVVLLSSLTAMFLQTLSLKLGVATDRDLVSVFSLFL